MNGRLSSLILTCSEFESRHQKEDIEERVVDLLNRRFTDLKLTAADLQVAHRLQSGSKVIVKLVKRKVRDIVHEKRFELARDGVEADHRGAGHGPGRGGPAPLFINESLTTANRDIYNALLKARKTPGGARVATVFSRRGWVYYRRERGGANIMVPDQAGLQRILKADGDMSETGRGGTS